MPVSSSGPAMPSEALGLTDTDRAAAHRNLFADFVAVVRRLRRDCPWDREQTHDSVKHLSIEEVYEMVDAIDRGDSEDLKKELGDLLLHVVFHAHIAETEGSFTLEEVMQTEMDKLVRRHPHVFGDGVAEKADTVIQTWEAVKRAEREAEREGAVTSSALDGVPEALPALLRAERVQEKAAAVGFDFPDDAGAWSKVKEEIGELDELARSGVAPEVLEREFGDVLFALVNVGRFWGVVPENALRRTVSIFTRRFQHIERHLGQEGRTVNEASLEEMDTLWNEAKRKE